VDTARLAEIHDPSWLLGKSCELLSRRSVDLNLQFAPITCESPHRSRGRGSRADRFTVSGIGRENMQTATSSLLSHQSPLRL
jgi:hypothetical protein